MSIPKEPRQLMVNLMYLVLTALLALNVSAEVLQAFLKMDDSLTESSNLAGNTNQRMAAAIAQHAEAYPQLQPFQEKVEQIQLAADDFYKYMDKLKADFIEAAGGLDETGAPKDLRNKDIPTNFFVNQNKGAELWNEFRNTRNRLLEQIEDPEDKALLDKNLAKLPDDPDGGTNWSTNTFRQLPVAASIPLLTKYKNDIKTAETAMLNLFFEKMNVQDKVDAYEPVIVAEQSYLTQGQTYQGNIFLASYNSAADNILVRVDGQSIPVENGRAIFTRNVSGTGTKEHQLEIDLKNPLTGEIQTFKKPFSYQVGEKSITVSATGMNVLYLGIDNPIDVSAAGIPSHLVQVKGKNVALQKTGKNSYIAKPQNPGMAEIIVMDDKGKPNIFEYRVKRIPDPVAELGGKNQGSMSPGEMKAQKGIIPRLKDFEFEAKCHITTFDLARIPKNGDGNFGNNEGNSFGSQAQRIIDAATWGDTYYFNNIRAKCPGESHTRELSPMVFQIR
jgi:gliding motility-associated protein GldM